MRAPWAEVRVFSFRCGCEKMFLRSCVPALVLEGVLRARPNDNRHALGMRIRLRSGACQVFLLPQRQACELLLGLIRQSDAPARHLSDWEQLSLAWRPHILHWFSWGCEQASISIISSRSRRMQPAKCLSRKTASQRLCGTMLPLLRLIR